MNIGAITVCVNYSDYLDTTLRHNKRHFKQVVVVTDPGDIATQQVAEKHGVDLVLSKRHRAYEGFNKGCMVNDGVAALTTDWICHVDADTVLTDELMEKLISTCGNRQAIIGCNRYMCRGVESFKRWERTGCCIEFDKHMRTPYTVPVGYFQVWHHSMSHRYDEDCHSAGHTDFEFSKKFKFKRQLNAFAIHLSNEDWYPGVDHKGRSSSEWNYEDSVPSK